MEGVGALVAALNRVRASFDKQGVEGVVMAACVPTAEHIASLAPVKTGALRDSIAARPIDSPGEVVTVGIGPSREIFYAGFVEFGTARTPAQPFMRPGFDEDQPALVARLKRGFGDLIKEGAAA